MSEPPSPLPTDDEQYLEALNRGNAFFLRGEFDEALEALHPGPVDAAAEFVGSTASW